MLPLADFIAESFAVVTVFTEHSLQFRRNSVIYITLNSFVHSEIRPSKVVRTNARK